MLKTEFYFTSDYCFCFWWISVHCNWRACPADQTWKRERIFKKEKQKRDKKENDRKREKERKGEREKQFFQNNGIEITGFSIFLHFVTTNITSLY